MRKVWLFIDDKLKFWKVRELIAKIIFPEVFIDRDCYRSSY